MANTISPNMSLIIPSVGSEQGPTYGFDINNSLSLIDQHDHSPGKGVQITPAGMNINTDISFNDHSAVNLLSIVFTNQVEPLSTVNSLSTGAGAGSGLSDLFFVDGTGTSIQITKSGIVNSTASSIPGESYSSGTFIWTQAQSSLPTTPANFDIGSITLRPNIAATTFGTQLVSPNSGNFTLNLPVPMTSGFAGVPNFLTMSNSGQQSNTYFLDNSTLNVSGNSIQVKPGGITTTQISSSANITGTQLSASANIASTQLASPNSITGTQIASQTIAQGNLALRSTTSPGAPIGGVAISSSTSTTFTVSGNSPNSAFHTSTQTATISAASPTIIGVASTASLYVGQPVVFTGGNIASTSLVSGTTYFISNIINLTTFNISATVYGTNLNNTGSAGGGITATFNITSVAIATTGRPVQIQMTPDGTDNPAAFGVSVPTSTGDSLNVELYVYRNGTIVHRNLFVANTNSSQTEYYIPPIIHIVDPVAAGNYSYTVLLGVINATIADSYTAKLNYSKLIAYEI